MLSSHRVSSPNTALLQQYVRRHASNILLKSLGLLLLLAAIMKAHELLTVPVANQDIWSSRPFLIFQVELELALGILLLSGVCKRLAWMAALACFFLFGCVALCKGFAGAASCGCFGRVPIHPWVILFAVDLPIVGMLLRWRPSRVLKGLRCAGLRGFRVLRGFSRMLLFWYHDPRHAVHHRRLTLNRSLAGAVSPKSVVTILLALLVLGLTPPILALYEPAPVTDAYTVLEPGSWQDRELPLLAHIDIGDQLRQGFWLVLLYHHDCPDCQAVMPVYERLARELGGGQGFLQVAFLELAPYGQEVRSEESPCVWGRVLDTRKWFVTTPVVLLLSDGQVRRTWERHNAPNFEAVLECL